MFDEDYCILSSNLFGVIKMQLEVDVAVVYFVFLVTKLLILLVVCVALYGMV